MTARPWMKFYPSDWRADPALRVCSLAARGLWMEMLCVMHEATPRGTLRINGAPMNPTQITALVGGNAKDVQRLLTELETAGVFSRDDNLVIYSRRMIRDTEKAELDKANGGQGGNPALKVGVNQQDKAHILETRNQNQKETQPSAERIAREERQREFAEEFWPLWPNKVGKPSALKAFLKARTRDDLETILDGVRRYERDKPAGREWLNPATFLNQERWNDQPASPPTPNGKSKPHDALFRAIAEQFAPGDGLGERPPDPDGGLHDDANAEPANSGSFVDLSPADYRRAAGPTGDRH